MAGYNYKRSWKKCKYENEIDQIHVINKDLFIFPSCTQHDLTKSYVICTIAHILYIQCHNSNVFWFFFFKKRK
jgi:hypothetical protein